MGYLAIARKWRPTRFEDLVGQGHVVQTLKNAIHLGRVSHAYLFSGARGVGKTSVARIFAKALRCPNAKEAIPCNVCEECRAIAESRSVDVAEIDGASNNGVEAVRGIRENVAYLPSSGSYKIYIIDEVHMLSLSAFNALLKTLEEPPSHVVFMFATTEVQKIPLTILSRCQRFEFRRLTSLQIIDRLRQILHEENVALGEEGLRVLASHADGSLRDALSLLDQVLSYFGRDKSLGEPLTEAQVVEALGVSGTSTVTAFLRNVIEHKIKAVLDLIGETYVAGVDLKHFSERLLEELRLLYLCAVARDSKNAPTAEELDVSAGKLAELTALVEKASVVQLERMAQILAKTISQLGWSSLPRFVLEMAAVRMAELDKLSALETALLEGHNGGTPSESSPKIDKASEIKAPAAPRILRPEAPAPYKQSEPQPLRSAPREVPSRSPLSSTPPQLSVAPPPLGMSGPSQSPEASWKLFVDGVMKKRPLLGALLCHANFKFETNPERNRVIVLAFPEGSFYERQASESKNRIEIEEQLKSFFGRETLLALSSDSTHTNKSIEKTKQAEAAEIKKSALEHPSVVKMKEILGAEVIDVNVEV